MGEIFVEYRYFVPPLRLLIKSDELVLGRAGKILVAEERQDDRRGEGDAVVQRAAGEEARDAAAYGCVGIYNICLVAGFDVAGDAAAVGSGGARGPCKAIGADAAAGVGNKVVGPAVGAG